MIDELPDSADDPLDNLVVAPHEFFVLLAGGRADRLRAAAASVCINTEQPGTPFFDLAMTYAARGPVVFDINRYSLDAVRRHGLAVVHLPLGCTPSMDPWGGDHRERHIDIGFLSGRTPRREQFIAGAGGMLWEWRTDLRFFSWHRPILGGGAGFATGAGEVRRARRHQDPAQRSSRRRAVLRVGPSRRSDRQRLRRGQRDTRSASNRSCPVCTC